MITKLWDITVDYPVGMNRKVMEQFYYHLRSGGTITETIGNASQKWIRVGGGEV